MATRHYVDASGNYLGGFGDGAEPPPGAIERSAPPNGNAIWSDGSWIEPEQPISAERADMNMTRPELVRAMGIAGILTTPAERKEFAGGTIPAALRTMIDGLPSEVQEDAEVLLLTGRDYPRVSAFWDAAIGAGQITATALDDVYRAIAAQR